LEEQADLFRLYSGKTSFPSAESHDGELIVLAGLHLQGTAGGSIGYDRGHQLRHGEGLTDTRRLHHPEILHDLLKQSFQVGHDVSLLSLWRGWKGCQLLSYSARAKVSPAATLRSSSSKAASGS
jgi:hypothetical protein